jgi:hypothetical protein
MKTEELLLDTKRFVPAWKEFWTPAPGMLDFEEKKKSFADPQGRMMVCGHRGDINIYYPENSLEGCLSAIEAGADMLEVDVHTTLDGVLLIMHDDTLTRTTNVSALRSEGQNWMPESDLICDWTWEQICRLRLKDKSGAVTEYAVPALKDVIRIAKDRVFITLDKNHAFRWEDVQKLIRELGAWETVLIPYNYPVEQVLRIREEMYALSGIYPPYFAGVVVGNGVWSPEKMQEMAHFLRENGMSPVLRGGYYNEEDMPWLLPVFTEFRKTHRIYAESMGDHRDKPEVWEKMLAIGCGIFMGNKLYDLLRIVKQRHFE